MVYEAAINHMRTHVGVNGYALISLAPRLHFIAVETHPKSAHNDWPMSARA